MKKFFQKILTGFVILTAFTAFPVLAADDQGTPERDSADYMRKVGEAGSLPGADSTTPDSIFTIIGQIINTLLSLLGIIILYFFLYGGYTWMMSQGNSEKIGEAKKMMVNAVIGFIIILLSYSISNFVLSSLIDSMITGV